MRPIPQTPSSRVLEQLGPIPPNVMRVLSWFKTRKVPPASQDIQAFEEWLRT